MANGLFDLEFRLDELTQNGDPLEKLNEYVPWEEFRPKLEIIRKRNSENVGGRPPFDAILMMKILVLQSIYNLSDDSTEYLIRDRLSFMRFLGLSLGDRVPDAKTIWLFREQIGNAGLVRELFDWFDGYLRKNGFMAKKGQIVDASIVSVPKQRNDREENAAIKNGEPPVENWSAAKRRQKDTDARWVKKNAKNFYGYKNHIQVDVKHKFVRAYKVTDASVHDSNVFEEILDKNNSSRDVYADSAYRSRKKEDDLKKYGYRAHLQRKGCRNKPLTEWEKRGNRTRSKVRSRIEHIFGIQSQRAGTLILRTIGIARANVKIGLRNLGFNLERFCTLRVALT
jgi:IS5 family transposase